MTTLAEVAAAAAELAPPHLAEEWDNVGLLVGDAGAAVERVICCLDLNEAVFAAAGDGAAVVAFHPPLFRPLARLLAGEAESDRVWRAVRAGIGLIATHTALDNARPGTSDVLAEVLGVAVDGVLRPRPAGELLKLVTFVPEAAVDGVAAAMSEAGAGRIGDYAECSFRSPGRGTFRGLAGTSPAVGEAGRLEQVDEVRLEMLVPSRLSGPVVAAMEAAHPYEEVAYDLYPLANRSPVIGLGRIGRLERPMAADDLAARVIERLGAAGARVVGARRTVERVALLGGSGGSFVADAARAGCDCLVTGDVRHHDALLAERLGLSVIDPGHAATELPAVRWTASALRDRLAGVTVEVCDEAAEPTAWRQSG